MTIQEQKIPKSVDTTHHKIIVKICKLVADEPCSRDLNCMTIRDFIEKHEIHKLLYLKYPEQITYIRCNPNKELKNKSNYKKEGICLYPGSPLIDLKNIIISQGPYVDLIINSAYPGLEIKK